MTDQIQEAAGYIQERISGKPDIAIVLGTGLGNFGAQMEEPTILPYEDIPHFPVSTVEGHAGRFLYGELEGKKVLLMQGRFHYYEGYELSQVTFAIRVLYELGCRKLVLTNAAGGVNETLSPGDLVLITDHVNLAGLSPLRGKNLDDYGPRFPDVADIYHRSFNAEILEIAKKDGIDLKQGVYFFMPGPQFETAAEIRMVRILGGDVVGMSTVPEAIVAAHMKMRVTGISCVTNMGTGVLDTPIDHSSITEVAKRVEDSFSSLVRRIVRLG